MSHVNWATWACLLGYTAILASCSGSAEETPLVRGSSETGGSGGAEAGTEASSIDSGAESSVEASVVDRRPLDSWVEDEEAIGESGPDSKEEAANDCMPSASAGTAAICITLRPELVAPLPDDETLDGQGVFVVEVHDTPTPDQADGGISESIATAIRPEQDGGSPILTMGVRDSMPAIRFENLPATTVYLRAYFFDNFAAFEAKAPVAGTWIGGYDLSAGFRQNLALEPVPLKAGLGMAIDLPMTALRRLRVTMTMAASNKLVGDGQGPAHALLFKTQQPGKNEPIFGLAQLACGDIKGPQELVVHGLVFGSGPYYALGAVDDMGHGLDIGLPVGAIHNLQLASGQPTIPASGEVLYPSDAYVVSKSLVLDRIVPQGGTSTTDTAHCGVDAGAAPH